MFIFQNTRWLKAFMGDPFKSCTVTVMRNVKSLDGDRHQKRGWTGWTITTIPITSCLVFVGLAIWGQKSKKSMPLGRIPGRMADGDEIVGIQLNTVPWFCSQSLVVLISGKLNVRDFPQSRDSLPKGSFRESVSNTYTTTFPPLLPGCRGASALLQDDLLKPW